MRHFLVIIVLCVMVSLACTLSGADENEQSSASFGATPTSANLSLPSPTPTIAIQATNTSAPSNQSGSSGSTCVPRSDWFTYTVVQGDTLGTIAQRANSTIDQLTTGNCLSNPNQISVGQRLYVPQVPSAPVVQPSPSLTISMSPYLIFDGSSYQFEPNSTISIQVTGMPASATSVEVYLRPTGTGITSGDLVGADTNLSNGAAVQWTVRGGLLGHINADAKNASGTVVATSDFILVYSEASGGIPSSPYSFTPFVISEGNQWQLEPETLVTIAAYNVPQNAVSVDYYFSPTGTGMPQTLIASDTDLSDGASISWVTPSGGFSGHIEGKAVTASGSVTSLGIATVFGGN